MIGEPKPGEAGVVLFEAYGALFDVSTPFRLYREALGHRAEQLATLWYAKQTEYAFLRTMTGHFIDFWHVTGEALDYALKRLSIADPVLRSRLMQAYFRLEAFPEAVDVLAALRRQGLRTAVLSNSSVTMLTSVLNGTDLRNSLDAVLSADQAKVFKPAFGVYQLACERFGLKPSQMAFVSTHGWDACGAAAFGLRSLWLNRGGEPPEQLPGRVEAEVASLAALPAFFAAEPL
ncbi:MAG: 2-haloacid dehalogenase [Rhodospirillaceae bacterium]|nr:MAG: 2-haloacid dehalogenase [Rhodospirillaceae bacterium]